MQPSAPVAAPADEPAPPLPTPEPASPLPTPEPDAATVRRRLASALTPKVNRGQVLAALLCAVLGFALVVQVRQTQDDNLDTLRETDLVRILDDLGQRGERLEAELSELRSTRDQLLSSSDQQQVAQEAAQERLDVLGILAGTAPATGPGIELTIADPQGRVEAVNLLDAVQELRDAGAEAIQVGDVRVVASTAFTDAEDGVLVDGRLVRPPYVFTVIGDPDTLAPALGIPGGVLASVSSREGARANVQELDTVVVDALRPVSEPQYARPAETPPAGSTP
ncbi:DUF881 domain-containing protein [Thalassiella azotivora]